MELFQIREKSFCCASCSCMTLTSKMGNHYWFRTCDIETDLWKDGAHVVHAATGSRLNYIGRKEEICQYAYTGMTYNHLDTWLLDGVNSEGLLGGLLMLYEGTSVEQPDCEWEGYVGMEIVTKMLSSCASVEEVILLAEKMQVLSIPYGGQYVPAMMHYFFTDITGNEVILEATDKEQPGRFRIYRKKEIIGVMTNSPEYFRQLENLSWYLSQSPELKQGLNGRTIDRLILDGREIKADSEAFHLSANGTFPASYSSYDRFIRVAVLKALNDCGNSFSDESMLAMGSHIMNAVNEPHSKGVFHYTCIEAEGKVIGQKDSCSQYLVMYDLGQRCFYIKAFDVVRWVKYQLTDRENRGNNIIRYDIVHDSMAGILEGNPL